MLHDIFSDFESKEMTASASKGGRTGLWALREQQHKDEAKREREEKERISESSGEGSLSDETKKERGYAGTYYGRYDVYKKNWKQYCRDRLMPGKMMEKGGTREFAALDLERGRPPKGCVYGAPKKVKYEAIEDESLVLFASMEHEK